MAVFSALALVSAGCTKPLNDVGMLNGCYRGEGLPDVLRQKGTWVMRIDNGVIFNRAGERVSRVELAGGQHISFEPGIRFAVNDHKVTTVERGSVIWGIAFRQNQSTKLQIGGYDWDKFFRTAC